MNIMDGKLNMMSAFTQKKLKLTGNMGIAMKLNSIFTSVLNERKKNGPTVQTSTNNTNNSSSSTSGLTQTTTKHKSGKLFEEIEQKLKTEGQALVSKVKAIIGFKVSCDNNQTFTYIVDLKTPPGSVFVDNGTAKAECTVAISDDDLLNIISGKLNMMNVSFFFLVNTFLIT
jgi:putative sterol carrier protein